MKKILLFFVMFLLSISISADTDTDYHNLASDLIRGSYVKFGTDINKKETDTLFEVINISEFYAKDIKNKIDAYYEHNYDNTPNYRKKKLDALYKSANDLLVIIEKRKQLAIKAYIGIGEAAVDGASSENTSEFLTGLASNLFSELSLDNEINNHVNKRILSTTDSIKSHLVDIASEFSQ